MPNLVIRRAQLRDALLLLQFIRELAAAEAFPFAVTVTQEDLEEHLFGSSPAAEALVAFADDEAAGFAVFYESFATTTGKRGLHLDDLFVRPAFRGRGYGTKILRHLAALAHTRGYARFEWWALRSNTRAISFYESIGARRMDELVIFRTQDASLDALAAGDILTPTE